MMKYTGTLQNGVIVAKGINYTDYNDPNEIELTEYEYNTIPIPCKLVDGEFVLCEYPKGVAVETVETPTVQEDIDAMLVDHEYRLTLLELGVNE
jgi:hypothetical protein